MISMIVAMAKNNVIGAKNRIPWLLRADLIHLKKLTQDQAVILGRKTYESMKWYYDKSGREMPGKKYIVVTSQTDYATQEDQVVVVHSIQNALKRAKEVATERIAVIGGEEIFKAILPFADVLYITEVDAEIDGDTFFPSLSRDEWSETSRQRHSKDERNQYDYSFVTMVRRKPQIQ